MNNEHPIIEDLEEALRDREQVRSLRLSGLQGQAIPESILSVRNLVELRISGSRLESLPVWLGQLDQLRLLEIDGAELPSVPDWLGEMPSLQTIRLSNCGIEHFPGNLLRLPLLRELDLSGNKISDVPPLRWPVQRYFKLDLSGNSFHSFPWNLLEMKILDLRIVENKFLEEFEEEGKLAVRLIQQWVRQMGMDPARRRQFQSLLALLLGEKERLAKVKMDDCLVAMRHEEWMVRKRAMGALTECWPSPFEGDRMPKRLLLSGNPGNLQVEETRHWLRGKGIELLQGRAKAIDCLVLGTSPGPEAEECIAAGAVIATVGHLEALVTSGLRGWLATPSKASSSATKTLEGLVISHEEMNRNLALTMMQGGGVPKHLLPVMLAWAWRGTGDFRQFALNWIGQEGPLWMRIFVEEEERRRYRPFSHWRTGRSVKVALEKLGSQARLFAKALASMGEARERGFLPYLNGADFERNMLPWGNLTISSEPEHWNVLPPAFQEPMTIPRVQLANCKYEAWPAGLENVQGLISLDLSSNSLSALPPEFSRYRELELLVLNKNKFAEFPEVILEIETLKELEMRNNFLASLPSGFSRLRNLNTIELQENAFRVFPESLMELPSLYNLNLSRWRSSGGIESLPNSIWKMERLEVLILDNHRLKELPPGFGRLGVSHLSLDGNPFSEFPSPLLWMDCLWELSLKNCKRIKELPRAIGFLSTLRKFTLSGTRIRKLPEEMKGLENLRYLDLSGCEFDDFDQTLEVIRLLPNLKYCEGPSFVNAPSNYKRYKSGYGDLVRWARPS